jgi:hypothetical protein
MTTVSILQLLPASVGSPPDPIAAFVPRPKAVRIAGGVPTELSHVDSIVEQSIAGLRVAELEDAVDLAEAGSAVLLALVRDLSACRVQVCWTLKVSPTRDASALFCLPPPSRANLPDAVLRTWHQRFRFGALHYRRGPGFLLVSDSRSGMTDELRIKNGALTEALFAAAHGVAEDILAPAVRAFLLRERLAILVGPSLVSLPTPIVRWPVPCNEL